MAAAGGGQVRRTREAEQADGGVAQGSEHLGNTADPHVGAIFVEGHVAHPG